ncbi:hypothetical protein GCM10010404_67440 [Nonomuraea africana]
MARETGAVGAQEGEEVLPPSLQLGLVRPQARQRAVHLPQLQRHGPGQRQPAPGAGAGGPGQRKVAIRTVRTHGENNAALDLMIACAVLLRNA